VRSRDEEGVHVMCLCVNVGTDNESAIFKGSHGETTRGAWINRPSPARQTNHG
jgi:hypothetical protein